MDQLAKIAKMIDHSLLHPGLTDEETRQGCRLARRHHVASVCVKPAAVQLAATELKGSDVPVGAVIGFPHGNSLTGIKVLEAEQAVQDGAVEIDMVVNIGKVLGGDWEYVEQDIRAVVEACHRRGAKVKVIFENDYLQDPHKVKLCEICSRVQADWVKTSTGYNFIKGTDGKWSYQGATDHDLKLMREHSAPQVQVKAAGGVGTLDDMLRIMAWVTRVGTGRTESILADARQRFGGG